MTMLIIGGIRIPAIEGLSDEVLQRIVEELLRFARSNPRNVERDILDFKRELNISDKYRIRKLFSSFANTRGGLLIVGIDEKRDYEVSGLTNIPDNERLDQILSTDDYIRPPVRCYPKLITYQGRRLLLYYIYENHQIPVEIRKRKSGQWEVWGRTANGTTRPLGRIEAMLKFYRGVQKLPLHAQVKISELGYYRPDEDIRKPFVEWRVKDQREVHRWLQIPWMPLIPLPLPFVPFRYRSNLYKADVSWFGKRQDLFNILSELEAIVHETYGIGFEVWTVPSNRLRTFMEDLSYFSGCGAEQLGRCLMDLCEDRNRVCFGWLIFGKSITCIIAGSIHGESCDLNIISLIGFIPNNFPFPSIDDVGRVVPEPLPVSETTIANNLKEWRLHVKEEFWTEDLSDEQLANFPPGRIIGYLGGRPRPRSYDLPFRADGLTGIETDLAELQKDSPPLVTNTAPLLCHISSAPSGLNDLKEIRVIGISCNVLPVSLYPLRDLTLVLFNVDCYVNQSKAFKLSKD